jgi:hypothetical protein
MIAMLRNAQCAMQQNAISAISAAPGSAAHIFAYILYLYKSKYKSIHIFKELDNTRNPQEK